MEYNISLSRRTLRELSEIKRYIIEHHGSPRTAKKLLMAFNEKAESLKESPKRHPFAPDERLSREGVRIAWVSNYALFFTVCEDTHTVLIHSVMHGSRDWANLL